MADISGESDASRSLLLTEEEPGVPQSLPQSLSKALALFETWDSTVYVVFPCPPCYPVFMQVTVEIPDQFVEHLVPAGRDAARFLLEESVAGAYRDGRLTMEQVRQLLGFGTRMQVDAFLQQHQIYDYTVDDLNKDMATLDRLATKAGYSQE